MLRRLAIMHSGKFQQSRKEIFNDDRRIIYSRRLCYIRITNNHRFTYSPFFQRAFAFAQRKVLVCTAYCITTIIGHENNHCIIYNAFPVHIIHQIPQTLIHSLQQSSILRLFVRKSFINIFLVETLVRLERGMYGIMTHV